MAAPSTTLSAPRPASAKLRTAGLWFATLLFAFAFGNAGLQKFSFNPDNYWVKMFAGWGLPVWFRLLIGGLETIAAVMVLIPVTAAYAGAIMVVIMIGAMITRATHGAVPTEYVPLVLSILILAVRWRHRWRPGAT